jgi:hypothetical protein
MRLLSPDAVTFDVALREVSLAASARITDNKKEALAHDQGFSSSVQGSPPIPRRISGRSTMVRHRPLSFAAVHQSVAGTTRRFVSAEFRAAIGGAADLPDATEWVESTRTTYLIPILHQIELTM